MMKTVPIPQGPWRYSNLARATILNPENDLSLVRYLERQSPMHVPLGERLACFSFAEQLSGAAAEKDFRRGDVENAVRDFLKLKATREVFDAVTTRISDANPLSDIRAAVAYLALNQFSTAYQICHASNFGTVAGLFGQHDDALIQRGIYDALGNVCSYSYEGLDPVKPFLSETLDASCLSIDDILAIRREEKQAGKPVFQSYLEYLSKWRDSPSKELSDQFARFLRDVYVPVIVRRLQEAQAGNGKVKELGQILVTLGSLSWGIAGLAAVGVGGVPVVTLVGAGAVAGTGGVAMWSYPLVRDLGHHLRYLIAKRGVMGTMNRYHVRRASQDS